MTLISCSASNEQTSKENAPLENTNWVLRVLNDKKIFIPESGKDIYITFTTEQNKFRGNAGCNNFFGTYTKNKSSLRLGPIAKTRMYCESQMETENAFIKALEETNKYKINGNNLYFYSNDTLLAKFDAFYLK